MAKRLMFALVIVVLMWLDSMVQGEEFSESPSPTPLPSSDPTPLSVPVSVQNLQTLQTMQPEDVTQQLDALDEPVAVHQATLKPDDAGESKQFKAEDSDGNYAFGYVEDHLSGGSFRHETRDKSGRVAGYYGLRDADGRVRIVSYFADEDGFRADIQSNEGNFEVVDPASTTINKGKPVAAANPYTYDQISGKGEFD